VVIFLITCILFDAYFADIIEKKQPVIYVIETQNNQNKPELIRTINLKHGVADEIEVFNNKLIVSTKNELTVLDPISFDIQYKSMPYNNPVYIEPIRNKLLVSFDPNIIAYFDENFKLVNKKELDFPILKIDFDHEKIYCLSQIQSKEDIGGKITIFHKKDLKFEKYINFPLTSFFLYRWNFASKFSIFP